jgi:Putative peptidoglycan binding domain
LACNRDQARLDNLKAAGNNASVRDDLKRLSQELTCERLRTQVVASLDKVTSELNKSTAPPPPPANTPELVASAQKQLARLGCYSGDNDGKLDADTKVAIKKYKVQSNQPVTDIAVTDSFVSELSKLKLRVCPAAVVEKPKPAVVEKPKPAVVEKPKPAVVEKPKPKDTRKEAKQERSKPSESRPQPQARQQASGGGAAHPMIGIGF